LRGEPGIRAPNVRGFNHGAVGEITRENFRQNAMEFPQGIRIRIGDLSASIGRDIQEQPRSAPAEAK